MKNIKGVIFDFGGTIDTNGIHWSEVIRTQYMKSGADVDNEAYRAAYVHGERTLAKNRIITPQHTFLRLLEEKIAIQFDYLRSYGAIKSDSPALQQKIVEGCYSQVTQTIAATCSTVQKISSKRPTVLVTNFYGNMNTVLKEFSLDRYFGTIVESSVVGIRKPDPRLFALGVEALGMKAEEVMVVGDSYRKDIHPSLTLGCKAVWLKKICWEEELIIEGYEPTAIIGDLSEIEEILRT